MRRVELAARSPRAARTRPWRATGARTRGARRCVRGRRPRSPPRAAVARREGGADHATVGRASAAAAWAARVSLPGAARGGRPALLQAGGDRELVRRPERFAPLGERPSELEGEKEVAARCAVHARHRSPGDRAAEVGAQQEVERRRLQARRGRGGRSAPADRAVEAQRQSPRPARRAQKRPIRSASKRRATKRARRRTADRASARRRSPPASASLRRGSAAPRAARARRRAGATAALRARRATARPRAPAAGARAARTSPPRGRPPGGRPAPRRRAASRTPRAGTEPAGRARPPTPRPDSRAPSCRCRCRPPAAARRGPTRLPSRNAATRSSSASRPISVRVRRPSPLRLPIPSASYAGSALYPRTRMS